MPPCAAGDGEEPLPRSHRHRRRLRPGRVRNPETNGLNDLDFTITVPDTAGGILPLNRPLVAVAIDTARTARHA